MSDNDSLPTRRMPPPIPITSRSQAGTISGPPPIPRTIPLKSIPSGYSDPLPVLTESGNQSEETTELSDGATSASFRCYGSPRSTPRSRKRLVTIFLVVGTIGITGGTLCWLNRDKIVPWLYSWIYQPSVKYVTADVDSQIKSLMQGPADLEITISEVRHRRGEKQGTWLGTARVRLVKPRYIPADWSEALEKAGFDQTAFSDAINAHSRLALVDGPKIPDSKPLLLANQVSKVGQRTEIPIQGTILLEGGSWSAAVDNYEEIRNKINELFVGQPLNNIGKNAQPIDDTFTQKALTSYILERQKFIEDVKAAQTRAEQMERQRAEESAKEEQTATGLVQACWYALERLSKYLINVAINQRLIDLSIQRGDLEKASLYRSYAKANQQNIQDAISSYEQGINDFSKLNPVVRKRALDVLRSELNASGISWKTNLVDQMSEDSAEMFPHFNNALWTNKIRQIRQQQ